MEHTNSIADMFSRILLSYIYLTLDMKGWSSYAPTLAFIIRLAQNMGIAHLGKERGTGSQEEILQSQVRDKDFRLIPSNPAY